MMADRTLLLPLPSPMSTKPCSEGGEPGGKLGIPASPAQLVLPDLGHFSEYSVPGVKPKLVVSPWLIASGANGNKPPPVIVDSAFWPAVAEAETVYAVAIL